MTAEEHLWEHLLKPGKFLFFLFEDKKYFSPIFTSVADLDHGSGSFLTSRPGKGENWNRDKVKASVGTVESERRQRKQC
jgi:hypothetical protein